jgi:hypothetical protein
MSWVGNWRISRATTNAGLRARSGRLEDSGFYGQDVPIIGIHQRDCISFAAGRAGPAGDQIVSYMACDALVVWQLCGTSSRTRPSVHPALERLAS